MKASKPTQAMRFAFEVHAGQTRRFSNVPFIEHPLAVAGLVASLAGAVDPNWLEDAITVAYLHAVVVNGKVKREELVERFGERIADHVMQVSISDTGDGDFEERSNRMLAVIEDLNHLAQTVICAAITHNVSNYLRNDKKLAAQFVVEMERTLSVLTKAHPDLLELAHASWQEAINVLREEERKKNFTL